MWSKFFPFRVDLFSEGTSCAGEQTGKIISEDTQEIPQFTKEVAKVTSRKHAYIILTPLNPTFI